jgi:hypothetical protein
LAYSTKEIHTHTHTHTRTYVRTYINYRVDNALTKCNSVMKLYVSRPCNKTFNWFSRISESQTSFDTIPLAYRYHLIIAISSPFSTLISFSPGPCTVQYCTVLYSTVLYSTVLYCTVQYCTVLYCTVLYSTVQYSTVLYCTVQYCTVQYCTIRELLCLSKDKTVYTYIMLK